MKTALLYKRIALILWNKKDGDVKPRVLKHFQIALKLLEIGLFIHFDEIENIQKLILFFLVKESVLQRKEGLLGKKKIREIGEGRKREILNIIHTEKKNIHRFDTSHSLSLLLRDNSLPSFHSFYSKCNERRCRV